MRARAVVAAMPGQPAWWLLLSTLAAAGWSLTATASVPGRLSPEVQQVCDDFWNWRILDMPEFATFAGIHDHDDLLDNLTMAAYDQRLTTTLQFLTRLEALEPTLTQHEDIVNVMVLRDELETYRDGYRFKNFYVAMSNKEGIQVEFVRLLSWMPLHSMNDYTKMLLRLEKLLQQTTEIIALLTAGVQTGIVLHDYSMNKVLSQIDEFLVSQPEDSPIYKEFFSSDFPANFTAQEITAVQDAAMQIIAEQVTPAYQLLSDYVAAEYATRPDIAVTALPNGTDLYAQLIKFHTGSDSTPAAIQQQGYAEVDRIEALMLEIVLELGYSMTVQEFSSMIRDDPNNYYTTEEDILTAFRHIVYNVTTPAVPMVFKNIPQAELQVVADPSDTGAFYLAGSYDGSRPGVFYVGTADLSSQPKFGMLTLSLHEGNPGHHLQGSHSIESPSLPYFRSVVEDRNYGHAPSRFPFRSYYMEGWGLYAESTGFDMDLFGDPLERYGHYSDEIFRACRLVVDTGMHALGWSRDEAIDYLLAHTAMTRIDVESQVDRYITWPGQALSYKTGQLQISEFRASAEQQLGELFDLKDFHDVVLESVGPMTLVEQEVDEWVQGVLEP